MKNNNKLIIIISIVLIVSIFAIWFFNRTFTVTIDYGNEKKYLKVKYNRKLDEKDILDKEKLRDIIYILVAIIFSIILSNSSTPVSIVR